MIVTIYHAVGVINGTGGLGGGGWGVLSPPMESGDKPQKPSLLY